MNEEFREDLEKIFIRSFPKQSLKPIILAYRDLNTSLKIQNFNHDNELEDFLQTNENNLIFIALLGIKDVHDGVPEAVALCKSF